MGGMPAVVAMRGPVPDIAAVAFSRTFYQRLAAGDPIEAAVTEGRLAIQRTAAEKLRLPAGYYLTYGGQFESAARAITAVNGSASFSHTDAAFSTIFYAGRACRTQVTMAVADIAPDWRATSRPFENRIRVGIERIP